MASSSCPFANRNIDNLDVVIAKKSDMERIFGMLDGITCLAPKNVADALEPVLIQMDEMLHKKEDE